MIPKSYDAQSNIDLFSAIMATVFEIVVYIWLVFGSSGMVNLLERFRVW